ncbi:MAG: divergent polysaccharide deacetylase family protein [Rhodospirillaceae bacterium]|jgi:uncharacterized protein|nr:divergent polysaccharide deacetylase family protein [Rhodospirillaceae bacterium]MBT5245428.1 divergent polysaccharide deacetylase family protein [Rhodospirillaceae bacterium]MBT5562584.1 divergent polysaccharide deacetylase family protein [Rhodospirillaceae bacterium]MBT6242558.1 divergent polysaccharide deacetylase family protein [Rhodospirillaceae bacterium]MBT7137207.1 divergent polysaccharide deacetylase family protein [Rhodospirillaceae bacterium]
MAYAGSLLAVIIAAYLLTTFFIGPVQKKPDPDQVAGQTSAKPKPTPWYQQQSPPPSMITTPDLPLFPEVEDQQDARAYEEALPKETYVPPVVERAPEQVSAPQVAALPATPELQRWRKYSVATPVSGQKPLIAIVIDDMGVDKRRSALAIDLQGPLTLSFLTYAKDIEKQTQRARNRGHELMLHVSMEPGSSAVDPGPNALLTSLSDDELRRRLEWSFGRFSTYVGVNNHMGSKFTANSKAMSIVIEEIKNRGLLFLDSRTSGRTVGAKLARKMGVPVAERNIFLDHENTIEAVHAQLRKVEQLARSKGSVIAIGHPRDVTIRALSEWLKDIEGRGFTLVPLTTLVLRNASP